ncbi:unnamed protein product [Rotaria socialis]|uniref:2,3-bisphosphoglycerate 3-phosphatase n=1 Tax=Rotaria socialis TaxID=392032 RepID=A0A817UHS7_9BILA|nr:unnamed protein product [Rotaria socialis]CAF4295091.1 unnamed protein product [Rotaria socialis]
MSWVLFFSITFITKVHTIDLYSPWIISAGPTFNAYKYNVLQHLTSISPYFESISDGLNPDPPQGCKVNKAVYLVRHGSIYVNDNDYFLTIEPFLQRLKNSSYYVDFSNSTELAFLTHWTSYILNSKEQIEKLAKLGFVESFNFGARLAHRYPHLLPVKKDASFKVWGSSANRTLRSAEALFAGLYAGHETIGNVVSILEGRDQGANTLTPRRTCPIFNTSHAFKLSDEWLKYYTVPIIARLNAKGSGFQFTPKDVLAMQELCGYETIIRGSSAFCEIFTSEEWLSFEYYEDIKYYYELGYGNTKSVSLGMPWVVATGNLLNQTDVNDQHLYISIVHRQMPPFVVTALGLYNDSEYTSPTNINHTLPLNEINNRRAWKTSRFLTFMGNIALERLDCASAAYTGSFVRVLVNSAPEPLPGCRSGPSFSCPLKQYMDYVKRRSDSYEAFTKACGLENRNAAETLSFFVNEKVV